MEEIEIGQEQMLVQHEKTKVMVAIDESENSLYALRWTIHNDIIHSDVVIFTVQPLDDYAHLHAASFSTTPPELILAVQENRKKMADALLEKASKLCTEYGVSAETATEVGDPKEAICEAVERLNIDLLVLGTHSKGPLQRAILGSVSNYCIHNAKCSVIVVRK